MPRRLASLAIFALALTGLAHAALAKPSVAVLGLQVIDDGDGLDEAATKFAKRLTDSLRARASLGKGPYALAPNSNKDLLEMKILSDCASEAHDCMAAIGGELGADRLLYGKIEKRADGYQVSLRLLNVDTQRMEKTTSAVVPYADGEDTTDWGKRLYNKLTGVPDRGALVVRTNADRGTIYIDGDVKGTLAAGEARIDGLTEGTHELMIESEGYQRHVGEVAITGGETVEARVQLSGVDLGPIDGADTTARPGGVSRALFWTSLVVAGGSAIGVTVTGLQVRGSLEDRKLTALEDLRESEGLELDKDDACGDAKSRENPTAGITAVVDACNTGQSRAKLATALGVATGVSAALALLFYYQGYIAPDSSAGSREAASRTGTASPTVHLAPTLGRDHVGAGVRIEF